MAPLLLISAELRPEELANTVITVGDPGRVNEVSKHFDTVELSRNHREFVTHTGYVGKKRNISSVYRYWTR